MGTLIDDEKKCTYKGEWVKDRFAKGTITCEDGRYMEGKFTYCNVIWGDGKWRKLDGNLYVGNWSDGGSLGIKKMIN